jgi:hypothetical protein
MVQKLTVGFLIFLYQFPERIPKMNGWRLSEMRITKNFREQIRNHFKLILILFLAVIFLTACTTEPAPAPSINTEPPTVIETVSATTAPAPTVTFSATAAILAPTSLPPTEQIVVETETNQENSNRLETNTMNIKIGDTVLTAALANNSSVDALKEALSEGPLTINMRDYGSMEKVGPLGMDLPRNDTQITTEAGDIILYQGNALVIYYAPNSWSFTRLGKINDISAEELKNILGKGNVTITLSLP